LTELTAAIGRANGIRSPARWKDQQVSQVPEGHDHDREELAGKNWYVEGIDAYHSPIKQTVLQKDPDTSGLIFSAFQFAQARSNCLYRLCTRAGSNPLHPDPGYLPST